MAIYPLLRKEIRQHMKENGFKSRGNLFYRIEEKLAFCIEFEQPTGVLYCNYYIIPLYIPAENRYFTYGNRLNSQEKCMLSPLLNTASDEDILSWIIKFRKTMDDVILPFFASISTVNALYSFLNGDQKIVRSYFSCPVIDMLRLKLFTALLLERKDDVLAEAFELKKELKETHFLSSAIIQKRLDEVNFVLQIVKNPQSKIDVFFSDTISNTVNKLFPLRK